MIACIASKSSATISARVCVVVVGEDAVSLVPASLVDAAFCVVPAALVEAGDCVFVAE